MINTVSLTPSKIIPCLAELHKLKMPAYIHGAPGIGKSTVMKDFAAGLGIPITVLMLSQIEAADLRGLPALDHTTKKTTWYPSSFLPQRGEGILFLDELSAAEPRLQVAAYQLILDRRVGDYHLPEGWWVVGAGNAPDDGALAYEMGTALADRLVHFKMVPESRDWIKWGQANGLAPEVLTFIQVKPDFLESNQLQQSSGQIIGPTPRSWHRVSDVIKSTKDRSVREYIVSGIVGESAAAEFFHVVEEVQDLPPIEKLLGAKRKEIMPMLPTSIAGLYGLTYSIAAFVSNDEQAEAALRVLNVLVEKKDEMPRSEIQALAAELLFEKVDRLTPDSLTKLGDSKEYEIYRESALEIIELK